MNLITDRTQADVIRANEINKKVYDAWASFAAAASDAYALMEPMEVAESTLTDAEFAEWLAGLKGAYNYSDLNRVESAVAELSEFLELGLVTKTNWGVWDAPTQADMRRYISNLQIVKERCASREWLPAAMTGFTYEYANSIEKMLSEAYVNKDTHNVWKKTAVTPKYVDKYTRVYDHSKIGTTGITTVSSLERGYIVASETIKFDDLLGFYVPTNNYQSVSEVVGWYDVLSLTGSAESICIQITEQPRYAGYREVIVDGETVRLYLYEYSYKVVGYAVYGPVREWVAGSYLGGILVQQGFLPQGTLIEGSLADGYCYVQESDGKYYYYKLR